METRETHEVSAREREDNLHGLKDKIFRHALHHFLEAGFAHVSIDELTSDLGMSKKTFYKCFASKDDLLGYIIEQVFQEIAAGIREILEDQTTFVIKLDRLMAFIGGQVRRMSKPLVRDMQRFAPQVWDRVEQFRRERIMMYFGQLVELGQKTGHIRSDVNPRLFLLAYLSVIEDILNPSVLANESFSAEEALHNIVAIFFHGVLTEDARREFGALHQTSQS